MSEPVTIADLFRSHIGNTRPAVQFGSDSWTYEQVLAEVAQRAAFLLDHKPAGAPFHVGVMFDNTPEMWFALGASAVSGATLVGINPTRRGAELARDIEHTDCAILLTEDAHVGLLDDTGDVVPSDRLFVVERPEWAAALAPYAGAALPETPIDPRAPFMLIFTSGTTGAPKAVIMSHGRLTMYGSRLAGNIGLGPDDVCYSVMPLFHSNAAVAGFANVLACGATVVLRRRFSASAWLPDVREYGVTFFNYVGKPLTYILATPEQADDADNPLNVAFGNEAAPLDIERFAVRFGCYVADGYGSTEGGINMGRTPDTPPGSLGAPVEPLRAVILDTDTGKECPRAAFDADGRFLNAERRDRRDRESRRRRRLRGLLQQRRSQRGADARRDVLDRRSRIPRRSRLLLLRRAQLRLAARRRRELRRSTGREHPRSPSRRRDLRGVRRAGRRRRRRRDGRTSPPHWGGVRSRRLHGLPRRAVRPLAEVGAAVRAGQQRAAVHRDAKGTRRVLRREHWECDDAVWWRAGRDAAFRLLSATDASSLREQFAARGRAHLLGRG